MRTLHALLSAIGRHLDNWLDQPAPLEGTAHLGKRDANISWQQPNLQAELRTMASRHAEGETGIAREKLATCE